MTHAEWLTCREPSAMLAAVVELTDGRRLRLYAAACARRVEHLLDCGHARPEAQRAHSRDAIRAAEAFADGTIGPDELAAAEGHAHLGNNLGFLDAVIPPRVGDPYCQPRLAEVACRFAAWASVRDAARQTAAYAAMALFAGDGSASADWQPDLIREIFGNPFRPITFDPAWRTANVLALARTAYDGRTWETLPVLADALEDAGCDAADLLAHLRGPGTHVRGCCALDLVAGHGERG